MSVTLIHSVSRQCGAYECWTRFLFHPQLICYSKTLSTIFYSKAYSPKLCLSHLTIHMPNMPQAVVKSRPNRRSNFEDRTRCVASGLALGQSTHDHEFKWQQHAQQMRAAGTSSFAAGESFVIAGSFGFYILKKLAILNISIKSAVLVQAVTQSHPTS